MVLHLEGEKEPIDRQHAQIFGIIRQKSFVHGILIFDPMEGFLEQSKLTPQHYLYCNVYIWFMNMASWYSDALYEDWLKYLDFFMSFHLQKSKKNKLQDRFQADNEF